MSNDPTRPDHAAAPTAIALWSSVGIAATVKYVAAIVGALAVVIINAIPSPPTPSGVAQAVVVGLYALAAYALPAAPAGVPAAFARWWQSAKTWAGIVAVPLSAVVPIITQYFDTGEWHSLTARGWMGVVLAFLTAVTVNKLPNREVTTIDQDGNALSPTSQVLEAIGARVDANRAAAITTLPADDVADPIPSTAIYSGTPEPGSQV